MERIVPLQTPTHAFQVGTNLILLQPFYDTRLVEIVLAWHVENSLLWLQRFKADDANVVRLYLRQQATMEMWRLTMQCAGRSNHTSGPASQQHRGHRDGAPAPGSVGNGICSPIADTLT
mmetsp:Transcript_23989/g.73473  ORF Transcript_23989/g.73473 Transcript_23989/m.73473 type:complete len:119 (+) Transcript_23989:833-1189(+)